MNHHTFNGVREHIHPQTFRHDFKDDEQNHSVMNGQSLQFSPPMQNGNQFNGRPGPSHAPHRNPVMSSTISAVPMISSNSHSVSSCQKGENPPQPKDPEDDEDDVLQKLLKYEAEIKSEQTTVDSTVVAQPPSTSKSTTGRRMVPTTTLKKKKVGLSTSNSAKSKQKEKVQGDVIYSDHAPASMKISDDIVAKLNLLKRHSQVNTADQGTSGEESKFKDPRPMQKMPKKVVRAGGGDIWEDKSLLDWNPNDYRIFCGDLGNDASDELLIRTFNRYSSFQKAKVIRDKKTGKPKGYGFVSFSDPADFTRAIKELNGKYVGGRPIKLRRSNWRERNIDEMKKKQKMKRQMGYKW